jgi:ABC-type transport system involved in cytochrome bd biosynthesis fused ATPase/permease subunit
VAPLRFAVAPGRSLGLVAPTGKGKTTLLRVLLGLEPPLAGSVRYGGVELGPRIGPGRRPFAWVPQDAPLIAGTLEENVGLGAAGIDPRRALRALGAEELHDALQGDALGAGGRTLSGGERQWVALARALEAGRPVLLLDEPTSGLDAASQARVLEAIAALRGSRTVVLVTHRREALAVCDEVIELG